MSLSKLLRCPVVAIFAFLPILLTGCATSNEVEHLQLPPVPAGLAACTDAPVPPVPGARGTPLTKAQAAEALSDQRASALSKDRCAHDWRDFYGDLGGAK